METRANYVTVGIFTLFVLAAAFAFIYWVSRLDETTNLVPLNVKIEGSVTGLGDGSDVLFNGIKVGKVSRVLFDANDPRIVYAVTQVKADTPIRDDTYATIGSQGLTGVAYISLKGGSPASPLLLQKESSTIPVISAQPSAVNDILETVREVAGRANTMMTSVESFINDNREPISQTVANVKTFSDSLAKNAEGVDKFLVGVSKAAESLETLSAKLDGSIAGIENIVKSVDPDKVRSSVDNIEEFTSQLKGSGSDVKELVASAKTAMVDLKAFSASINTSLASVDKLLAAADAEKIGKIVDNVSEASENAKSVIANANTVTDAFARRKEDIDAIVTDTKELVATLNKASGKVDGVLTGLDGLLSKGDGTGVMEEVRQTLADYRELARTLTARANEISSGLSKFSNRGLDDVRTLVQDTRRSVGRIDRVISGLEDNPQRLLFGGEEVKQFNGRPRR
ncbi:MAG: MCE family protein [Nitratireductor sp.]|nr:MCE family protein [Nitratireductor sp.]